MAAFCFIIMASSIMSLQDCLSVYLQKTTHNYPILGGYWPISGIFHHFPTLIHNSHFHWSFLIGCYSETQVGYLLWGAQTHSSNTYLSLSEICFLQFFLLSRLWTLSDGDRNLEIMIRHLELISIPGTFSSFTTSDIITRKWQRRHRRPCIKVKWAGKPYRQVPSIFSLNQVESHGHLSTHWQLIAYCFYFPSWLGSQPGPSCVLGKYPTLELHSLLTPSILWCVTTLSLS